MTFNQWRSYKFEPGGQSLAEGPTGHCRGVHEQKLRKRLGNDSESLDDHDVHTG